MRSSCYWDPIPSASGHCPVRPLSTVGIEFRTLRFQLLPELCDLPLETRILSGSGLALVALTSGPAGCFASGPCSMPRDARISVARSEGAFRSLLADRSCRILRGCAAGTLAEAAASWLVLHPWLRIRAPMQWSRTWKAPLCSSLPSSVERASLSLAPHRTHWYPVQLAGHRLLDGVRRLSSLGRDGSEAARSGGRERAPAWQGGGPPPPEHKPAPFAMRTARGAGECSEEVQV